MEKIGWGLLGDALHKLERGKVPVQWIRESEVGGRLPAAG